jgi:uncharacterized membrane-anchored protein
MKSQRSFLTPPRSHPILYWLGFLLALSGVEAVLGVTAAIAVMILYWVVAHVKAEERAKRQ